LLAAVIHQELALPILPKNALLRVKNTSPQAKCRGGREGRVKNMENAFAIHPEYSAIIYDKTILLVDDIATTGSTLNEAARMLKNAGARQVWGIVVAKG
ncbi:MAG: phosphoribosyltransferase family protein, partial [Patescibacteria group bacterium]